MTMPDSPSLDLWTWVALIGCALVIPGVILESAEYVVKWRKNKSFLNAIKKYLREPSLDEYIRFAEWLKPKILKVESLGFFLLVIGLAIEIFGSFEADRLQSKQNSELNWQTELLRSKNLALQQKLQPRIITGEQITNFIFLTEKLPKFPIGVLMGGLTDETLNYATQFREMLERAGYKIPKADTNFPTGVRIVPTLLGWHYQFDPTNEYSSISFFRGYTNGLRSYDFRYEMTNGYCRPIVGDWEIDETNKTFAAISFILGQISITYTEIYAPDWAGLNGNIIFVNQRIR